MKEPQKALQTKYLFEEMPVSSALMKMAMPTIASQLVTLVYNIADTWFIARTDNPYMVAASSLVLTLVFMMTALAALFGTGGGTLAVQLMGSKDEEEARRVASLSIVLAGGIALLFSLLCLVFMDPLLRTMGASDNTIGYAKQYLFFVVVIGGVPTVLSQTMSSMVRNAGYSRKAGFGLSMGGILNVILDPIFMFLIMPDGYEVVGAAIATMLSNVISFVYFVAVYKKLQNNSILEMPRRIERVRKESLRAMLAVGVPAAVSIMLYDLTNIVINRLASSHGDIALAAMGIVLKVERLPLNICIGICMGMTPLIAYNFASGNRERMKSIFSTARIYGLIVSAVSLLLYRVFAADIMQAFISEPETVRLGTEFLRVRCFAPAFMFLSFHMVHYMQSVKKGEVSFYLAAIRQLCLNIPILFLMDHLFGASGIVWTQVIADVINVCVSYVIYHKVRVFPAETA